MTTTLCIRGFWRTCLARLVSQVLITGVLRTRPCERLVLEMWYQAIEARVHLVSKLGLPMNSHFTLVFFGVGDNSVTVRTLPIPAVGRV